MRAAGMSRKKSTCTLFPWRARAMHTVPFYVHTVAPCAGRLLPLSCLFSFVSRRFVIAKTNSLWNSEKFGFLELAIEGKATFYTRHKQTYPSTYVCMRVTPPPRHFTLVILVLGPASLLSFLANLCAFARVDASATFKSVLLLADLAHSSTKPC